MKKEMVVMTAAFVRLMSDCTINSFIGEIFFGCVLSVPKCLQFQSRFASLLWILFEILKQQEYCFNCRGDNLLKCRAFLYLVLSNI